MLNQVDLLRYEVTSSWWAGLISIPTLQRLASRYLAWKTNRKYRRYKYTMEFAERMAKRNAMREKQG